jgi:hypothetical protein
MAQTSDEQLPLLHIFSRTTFPLDHSLLLRLGESDDERVAVASTNALTKITHPSVRDFAFRLVENSEFGRGNAISMLAQNWKLGDHEIALRWFEREEDRVIRHRLGIDLRNFWERHTEPANEVPMLQILYEHGPCSMCREFVVRRLIELNALTPSMREECAYDANDDVRGLVGAE